MRRKLYCSLALCLAAALCGCGRHSDASSRRVVLPSRGSGASGTGTGELPGVGASSVPKAETEEILDRIKVEVEDLELDTSVKAGADPIAGLNVLAIKVKVSNNFPDVLLHVSPMRFYLECEDGEPAHVVLSRRKEPVVPTTFLETNQVLEGWLTFRVPAKQWRFRLMSDLRRTPPIEIPINLSIGR